MSCIMEVVHNFGEDITSHTLDADREDAEAHVFECIANEQPARMLTTDNCDIILPFPFLYNAHAIIFEDVEESS